MFYAGPTNIQDFLRLELYNLRTSKENLHQGVSLHDLRLMIARLGTANMPVCMEFSVSLPIATKDLTQDVAYSAQYLH